MRIPAPLRALGRRFINSPHRRALALKAICFALIGFINFGVDLGIFSFFYYYVGLPIILSNTISWFIAVTGSFVMNSLITFAAESGRRLRLKAYATFLIAQVAGFLANTATIFIVSYSIPVLLRVLFNAGPAVEIGHYTLDPVLIGKLFAVGASFLVNFTLSHFVVFRQRGQPAAQ